MSEREINQWTVNIVSAFGRSETLALALIENGFEVQVLDFTEAMPATYQRGTGPFPVLRESHLPAQKDFLNSVERLPQGLTFWLPEGPIELTGQAAEFHSSVRPDVKAWRTGQAAENFDTDWIQNFFKSWTSAYHSEAWQATAAPAFPAQLDCGLVSVDNEFKVASFERYRKMKHPYAAVSSFTGVELDGRKLVSVENGDKTYKAERWIWCLSAEESDLLMGDVAQKIFQNKINLPVWSWIALDVKLQRGPWSNGFPEYLILLNDIHLPWTHSNQAILRRLSPDRFRAWIKVPAVQRESREARAGWAAELQSSLNARLPLAKWQVDGSDLILCSHSPVYGSINRDHHSRGCRNMEWIAPETLSRLDWAARLESEAGTFERLSDWRTDQMRKQGAERDHTLHPS